jgi:hypothetical protein
MRWQSAGALRRSDIVSTFGVSYVADAAGGEWLNNWLHLVVSYEQEN